MGLFKKNKAKQKNIESYTDAVKPKGGCTIELCDVVSAFVMNHDKVYRTHRQCWDMDIQAIMASTKNPERMGFRLYIYCHKILGSMGYSSFEINDCLNTPEYHPLAAIDSMNPVGKVLKTYVDGLFTDLYINKAIKFVDSLVEELKDKDKFSTIENRKHVVAKLIEELHDNRPK